MFANPKVTQMKKAISEVDPILLLVSLFPFLEPDKEMRKAIQDISYNDLVKASKVMTEVAPSIRSNR